MSKTLNIFGDANLASAMMGNAHDHVGLGGFRNQVYGALRTKFPDSEPAKLEGESARRTKDALFYSTVLSVLWPSIIGFPRRNRGGDDAHNIMNSLHCYHQRKITCFWSTLGPHTHASWRQKASFPYPKDTMLLWNKANNRPYTNHSHHSTRQNCSGTFTLYASQNKPRNEESLPCNEKHLFCLGQDLSEWHLRKTQSNTSQHT